MCKHHKDTLFRYKIRVLELVRLALETFYILKTLTDQPGLVKETEAHPGAGPSEAPLT